MTCRTIIAWIRGFVLATAALGQTTTGIIVGTINDPSQAAMPGVQVTVTNVDTGIARSAVTSATGGFTIPSLLPGVYTITATSAGFKRATIQNLVLRVDQELRQDITMQIGETAEQVTVSAETVAVGTETPAMGTVIVDREMVNMPLNGRSFIQLATLSTGVTSPGTAQGESVTKTYSRRTSTSVSISGQREFTSEYRFDGIPSKDRVYGPVGMQMDIDSIAEFNIQRGYASADVGLSGRINVATKSGTNQFHGAAWEFLRNEKLDARNFFAASNLPYRQNQYGVSLGGPILKNRLFFFGDYEGLNIRQASPALGVVPTPEMLQGNFSGLAPVIDPNTRAPFPGNIIPASRISNFAKTLNQYYAPPNTVGAFNRVISTRFIQDDTKYNIRVDFAASSRDTFFGRFTFSDSEQTTEGFMPYGGTQSPLRSRNAVASWTHVFSPTLLNDFKAGLDRVKNFPIFPQGGSSIPNFNDVFGFTNLLQLEECNQLPSVSIASFNAPTGIGNCITLTTNDYHFIDNLSYTHGRHQLSVGFEIMRVFMRQLVANWGNGSFSFNGQYTRNSAADYLLGIPNTTTGGDYARVPDRRATWPSFYINDQIKLTRNLNLSLGLRWEYFQPLAEDRRRLVSFDPFVPAGGFMYEEGSGMETLGRIFPPGLLYPDKNNWAPRIGMSYSPSPKLAIRSSYGIFYQEPGGNRLNTQQTGPPFVLTTSLVGDPQTPTIYIDTAKLFPQLEPPYRGPGLSSFGFDPYARTPYLQTWTLSVQRSLPASMFVEMAYVGSKGVKLDKLDDINMAKTPPPPGFTGTLQSRRPFPDFAFVLYGENKANSYYHALQLTLRRQWSRGLTFMGGYTFGKSLDGDSFDNKACRCYIPGNPGKARSVFDQRQRFVFSLLYNLPFRFSNRVAQTVLGGWQVSGITTLQTGFPFNVRTSIDYSNRSSIFLNLPNRICDGNLPSSQRTPTRWFDTGCFTTPAQNTLGNAGFQFLDTDGVINQDLGVSKDFVIREPLHIQFRGEFFNTFNHPSFGAPNGVLENAVYGRVSTALPARIIQFGVRLRY